MFARLLASFALGILFGGCGLSSEPQTNVKPVVSISELFENLDLVDPSDLDAADLESRLQEAIRNCMSERGFEYFPPDPEAPSFIRLQLHSDAGQTLADEDGIAKIVQELEGSWRLYLNDEYTSSLTPEAQRSWSEALHGNRETGTPGCFAQAFDRVNPYGEHSSMFDQIETAVLDRLTSSDEWTALEDSWSRCMAERGYEVFGASDDYGDYLSRLNGLSILNMLAAKVTGDPSDGVHVVQLTLDESRAVLELTRAESVYREVHRSCLESQEAERINLRATIEKDVLATNPEILQSIERLPDRETD